MRHRIKGRKLGRTPAHRKAMFRNMACSLIRSLRFEEDDEKKPKVPGRIVTTVEKAKELRPFVEKLVTMARKALVYEHEAIQYEAPGPRGSSAWRQWRESEQWNRWNQAIAPAVALRRRAFAMLRDAEAVDILFDELANRFRDRNGGYTRIVRLPKRRLGDAGQLAFIEFVGERDRIERKRKAPVVAEEEERPEPAFQPAVSTPAEPEAESAGEESQAAEAAAETPTQEQQPETTSDVAEAPTAEPASTVTAEAETEAPAKPEVEAAAAATETAEEAPASTADESATAEAAPADQTPAAETPKEEAVETVAGQETPPEPEGAADQQKADQQEDKDESKKKSRFRRWFGR